MKTKRTIIISVPVIFLVILVIYYVVSYNIKSYSTNEDISTRDTSTVSFDALEQILSHQYKVVKLSDKKMYLFINTNNFQCHSCYEQFLKIIDIVNSRYKKNAKNVLLLFPENKEEGDFQEVKLKKWLQLHNLSYEHIILKNESVDLSLKRSCVILKKNEIIAMNIPMQANDLERLQKLL